MRHALNRISLAVLVLIALVLIVLVLALVWSNFAFSQPIAVYLQSLESVIAPGQSESRQLINTAGSIKFEYRAWLDIEKKDGVTHINLVCENLTDSDATLQYLFFIEKDGPEGKFSSQQSGSVRIKARQKGIISHAEVSVPPGFFKVSMAIYKDGNLVARDERTYPGQEI